MRSAITVSLVPQARGGPFVFWDNLATACEAASTLGFDAIEIFPPSAEAIDFAAVRELLTRHSLKVAAIGTGAGWVVNKWHLCHADPSVREQARIFIAQIVKAAGELDAPAIIGSMQGRSEGEVSREQALAWLRPALEALAQDADRYRQPLLFEPLNRYETNLFNRIGDVADFIDTLAAKNVKILADLYHMNIEEASMPAALRAAARHVGHVHFADSNRYAVGRGHTDIEPVIAALREIGYDGYLSAEILPLPDSHAAARQTIESFRKFTSLAHA